MRLSMIAALGTNRAIGRANHLLWRIPGDLPRFKALTMGHAVIMGRRTWESIGRPLPGRLNLVLSRRDTFAPGGATACRSLEQALEHAARHEGEGGECFVIGGAELYTQALPRADRLYLTLVEDAPADADAFFQDPRRTASRSSSPHPPAPAARRPHPRAEPHPRLARRRHPRYPVTHEDAFTCSG